VWQSFLYQGKTTEFAPPTEARELLWHETQVLPAPVAFTGRNHPTESG
jgi:hypothetical protein